MSVSPPLGAELRVAWVYATPEGPETGPATVKAVFPVYRKKFRSRERAGQFLDEKIKENQPVGCQVGVYYLTYFPKEYRFHFNAHNLVVYGKENDEYLISDPVMEDVTRLTSYELQRVRFAKGALAPRGQIYFPEKNVPVTSEQIKKAIVKGIKLNVRDMLHIPGPIAGVNGIKYTAKRIKKWRPGRERTPIDPKLDLPGHE